MIIIAITCALVLVGAVALTIMFFRAVDRIFDDKDEKKPWPSEPE
jgi:hypothetical protein